MSLPRSDWLRPVVPIVVGGVLVFLAGAVLHVELRAISLPELYADALAVPPRSLALAFTLTAVNYAVLTGYDLLSFAYIGKVLPRARIALTSFLAYAISNNVGFAMLSGTSVRYRFYTRWGLTAEELSRVVISKSVTFWVGLCGLGGLSFLVRPPDLVRDLPLYGVLWVAAWGLLLTPPAYVAATVLRTRPLRLWRLDLPLPTPTIATGQVLLSALEWTLAGAVLYALLPASDLTFVAFIGTFVAAILLGMVSHVPGGVGVFEGLMVLLLKPHLTPAELLPALVVYRVVYYLVPLTVAVVILVTDVGRQHRAPVARAGTLLGRLAQQLAPRVLAVFTFLAGVVLLVSGATPAATERLALLGRVLPTGVIEASHFLSSIAGVVLLMLSQGLARRLDAAYYLAAATMVMGMAASLLKGLDYEEVGLLLLVVLILWRARPAFDRRAAFFDTRFSVGWIAAIVGSVGASIWLGLFAFQHVDYSHELWWQFALQADVSRFLRASAGSAMFLLLFGFARLIRRAPYAAPSPTAEDLGAAVTAIAAQSATAPLLVYLRDKALLFNEGRTAFVMYGVQGRTWVALGDPVGPDDECTGLIRAFLERCDDFGGVPVFYEVGSAHLHRYADFGLTLVKLGEEAKVDLARFSLEGGHASKYRQVVRRLEKDRCVFRIVAPDGVPAVMAQLRAVSDDWLAAKSAAEKGFSLGFFDEAYVARFPVAVIERDGRIHAFSNILQGPGRMELSVDLMRHDREAPKNVMEALFVHLMVWGKVQGYQRFALGMAPLSGFEHSPVATLWNRLGAYLYMHGGAAYGFQGLRAFKEKFDPVWEPRYLVYPGGLHLPRIVADVAALVAGGYLKIFRK